MADLGGGTFGYFYLISSKLSVVKSRSFCMTVNTKQTALVKEKSIHLFIGFLRKCQANDHLRSRHLYPSV